jgi:hypothetical protein
MSWQRSDKIIVKYNFHILHRLKEDNIVIHCIILASLIVLGTLSTMHYAFKTKNHTVLFQYINVHCDFQSNLRKISCYFIYLHTLDQSWSGRMIYINAKFPNLPSLLEYNHTLYSLTSVSYSVSCLFYCFHRYCKRNPSYRYSRLISTYFVIFWKNWINTMIFREDVQQWRNSASGLKKVRPFALASPYLLLDVWFWMTFVDIKYFILHFWYEKFNAFLFPKILLFQLQLTSGFRLKRKSILFL